MSNNTSKQKVTTLAMVGVVVAAAIIAAVSFAPITASAQERPNGERDDVRIHRLRTASGAGIATDIGTGEDFRSAFRAIWHYNNSTDERTTPRGTIVISVDGKRIPYQLLPDTWEIKVAEDGLTFEASGQVQHSDSDRVFDVSLNGYLGGPVGFVKRIGTTWSVDGVMAGEEREYELHYVLIAHLGRLAVIEE